MSINFLKKDITRILVFITVIILISGCAARPLSTVEISPENNRKLANNKSFIWGVNGHPVTNMDYVKTALEQDINLLKEHQFTFYRFELRLDSDGKVILNPDRFMELIKKSSENGIELLPVILINKFLGEYQISEEEAYNRGMKQMRGFAELYGDYIQYYALGNEQELRFIHPNSDGKYITDYDLEKFTIVASYLKGMNQGLKEVKPEAKTIINSAGWLHYGYYELLEQAGVPYDILGYHWYSKTETFLSDFGDGKITELLYKKYQKPIWITEINYTRGSHDSEEEQAVMVKRYIEDLCKQQHIEAFFIYELYDQPYLIGQEWAGAREANFGIVRWLDNPPDYSKFEYKPVSNTIRFGIEKATNGYENYAYTLLSDLVQKNTPQKHTDFWANRYETLQNTKKFIDDFFESNEIKSYNDKTPELTITKAYENLLHRNPTDSEIRFWIKKLKKNPETDIRKTIVTSEEYWEKAIWQGYERRTGHKRI